MGESKLNVCATCGAPKDDEGRHTCACHEKPPEVPNNAMCPHCGTDPIVLSCRPLPFSNGVTVLMVWCATPTCRKMLSVSFMGAQAQRASGLVLPS